MWLLRVAYAHLQAYRQRLGQGTDQ
ncbi:2-dehydropantoate 2-reductase (fragment) [Ralstonia solanacearum CFBP2957]